MRGIFWIVVLALLIVVAIKADPVLPPEPKMVSPAEAGTVDMCVTQMDWAVYQHELAGQCTPAEQKPVAIRQCGIIIAIVVDETMMTEDLARLYVMSHPGLTFIVADLDVLPASKMKCAKGV